MTFGPMQQPATAGGEDILTKGDLKDQLAVFKLVDVEDDVETKFGTSTKATAEVLVCEGKFAGTHDPEFTAFGNLAKQLARIGQGVTAAGRVIQGENGQRTFWGVDFDLSSADEKAAEKAVKAFTAKAKKSAGGPKGLEAGL